MHFIKQQSWMEDGIILPSGASPLDPFIRLASRHLFASQGMGWSGCSIRILTKDGLRYQPNWRQPTNLIVFWHMRRCYPPQVRTVTDLVYCASLGLTSLLDGALVATHSFSEKLSLYRIQVMWTPSQWDPAQQRQASGALNFPVPTIHITHCKTEVPGRMFGFDNNQADDSETSATGHSFLYQLTSLEVVSGQSDNTGNTTSAPWILAVYSSPLSSMGHDHQQQEPPPSVMVRWQLETSTLNLHPVFEELVSKKANGQHKVKLTFSKHPAGI